MPKRRYLHLTVEQHDELEVGRRMRPPYATAYVGRRRSVAQNRSGMLPYRAVLAGGLKSHQPKTIYQWLDWYEADGVTGLKIQPGRDVSPLFLLKHVAAEAAPDALLTVVRLLSHLFEHDSSRWTLAQVGATYVL
ncbi:MAG: hypothetical protein M3220_00120 [Chloroflexota bacterium]|nr:hypothetical protein [Chloroflexota bacterium]